MTPLAWLLAIVYVAGVGVAFQSVADNGRNNSWWGASLAIIFWPLWGLLVALVALAYALHQLVSRPRLYTKGDEIGAHRFHGLVREGWRPSRFVGFMWRKYTIGIMRWERTKESTAPWGSDDNTRMRP